MKREIILLSLATLMLTTSSYAQDKKETKLYNTTINKGDLKSFNKFLNKYPNSTYAIEINKRVDSLSFFTIDNKSADELRGFIAQKPNSYYTPIAQNYIKELNTTKLSKNDAQSIVEGKFGIKMRAENPQFLAFGFKIDGTEKIATILAPNKSNPTQYRVLLLSNNGEDLNNSSNWNIESDNSETLYNNNPHLSLFSFITENNLPSLVELKDGRYIKFDYKNENSRKDIEYVTNLYSINDGTIFSALFSGRKEFENGEHFLEGSCMDASQGGALGIPQMSYLINFLGNKSYFRPFSKDKLAIDTSIEWWYSNNKPNAKTLAFGIIPNDNPIVSAYKKAKYKERDSRWEVALVDIRENTIVVAYDKVTKKYSLVWSEPMAKDKERDQLLNSIYFERNTILALYYYKGNTTYKKRVNLASKTIR